MDTPLPVDRRARRSLKTRDAIRRSAIELVADRGLEGVSVEQIAEHADVGYRTFFNHFSCKEEALVEPGEQRAARIVEALAARPLDESPLDALRAVMVAEAKGIEERGEDLVRLRFAVMEANPVLMRRFHAEFSVLERAVVAAVAARVQLDVDRDLYPHLVAATANAAMRTAVLRWHGTGSQGSLPDLVDQAFRSLAAGLPAPADSRAGS